MEYVRATENGIAKESITPNISITITIPPISAATDQHLISTITRIVNTVYGETEGDIFIPEYKRTNEKEICGLLGDQLLAVAYLDATNEPIGCVFIKRLNSTHGEFGMLALEAEFRGSGWGREIILFVEKHFRKEGCTVMRLELLVPTTFKHSFKERLQAWYLRMGFELVKLGNFKQEYPQLEPLLTGPTEYRIFEKNLI